MDTLAVLTAAAALIEHDGHCQGADALDATGKPTLPIAPRARTWSMTGALMEASREASGAVFLDALRALAVAVGARVDIDIRKVRWEEAPEMARAWSERLWKWEDAPGRTIEHVLRTFDRAKESYVTAQQEDGSTAREHRGRESGHRSSGVSRQGALRV